MRRPRALSGPDVVINDAPENNALVGKQVFNNGDYVPDAGDINSDAGLKSLPPSMPARVLIKK